MTLPKNEKKLRQPFSILLDATIQNKKNQINQKNEEQTQEKLDQPQFQNTQKRKAKNSTKSGSQKCLKTMLINRPKIMPKMTSIN
jgi:hypothetical protein